MLVIFCFVLLLAKYTEATRICVDVDLDEPEDSDFSPSHPSTTDWTWKPESDPSTTIKESKPYESPLSGYYKVVCYFTNWAWYRQGEGKYLPEDINPDLCTHIIYAFALLDYETLTVKVRDTTTDLENEFYKRVGVFKRKGIKVSLALGGYDDSEGNKYSRLVNNPESRNRFTQHIVKFLKQHEFDGLDLYWMYPKCWQNNCNQGPDSDKQGYTQWVRELKNEFLKHNLLLSAAVSPGKNVIDTAYDVKTMSDSLDWISVLTYNYHGHWDKKTGHVAPMYKHPDDDFYNNNTNYTINYWIGKGANPRKLVLGMPLHGRSFTVSDPICHGLNCTASGPGTAGEFTRAGGFLAYYEICERVQHEGWTVVQDEHSRIGPFAYKDNQWVGYDDKAMIKYKSKYIREMNLGGGMIWALDLDDFNNTCGDGAYPLLTTIAETLSSPPDGIEWIKPKPNPTKTKPKSKSNFHTGFTPPMPSKPNKIQIKPHQTIFSAEESPPDMESNDEVVGAPKEEETTTTEPTSKKDSRKPKPKSKPKPALNLDNAFKVVCYFTTWSWYRHGTGEYHPTDIDSDLCTHIVYAFAVLDENQMILRSYDTWADLDNKFYEKVTAFKKKGVKVLIAIGGWADSAGGKYSKLVNSASNRQRFIEHVVKFILDNNFDGLDLYWSYPKCWQANCQMGPKSDKGAFSAWIKELHAAFKPHGLRLSASVCQIRPVIDEAYDVPVISEYLDWINVLTFDYHGHWNKRTGHVAPLDAHPEDGDVTLNTNYTIHYWVSKGADSRKLLLGMPMYGQSYSLSNKVNNGLNAPIYGRGEAGEETRAGGFLAYYEICERVLKKGWEVVKDPKGAIGPYARLGDQWVSFDDQAMIQKKSQFVINNRLGGAMIWAIDLDDFRNQCGCEKYPLLRTVNRVLRKYPGPAPDCRLDSGRTTLINECQCGSVEPYPSDCTKYFVCIRGNRVERKCPLDLHFNPQEQACDFPSRSGCNSVRETNINSDHAVISYK